jgi:hypothetical protein
MRATTRSLTAILAAILVPAALAAGMFAPAGDAFDAAAKLVPADAVAVVLLPSPKAASDDLQQALDRMGRAESALGGRPIDLLKAQLRIGPGFDDRGPCALWIERRDGKAAAVGAFPVTDAKAFIAGTFTPAPDLGPDAYRMPDRPDQALFVREAGKHVIVAQDARSAQGYDPKGGIGAALAAHAGERGLAIMRAADACSWAGESVFADAAAAMRAATDPNTTPADRERGADVVSQVTDGIVAFDFDALGVGIRAHARFREGSEIAKAIQPSAKGAAPRMAASLLGRLPAAPYYGALGIDLLSLGGSSHLRGFLRTIPRAQQVELPPWLDAVQDKVQSLQVAAYPSKLGVLSGGVLNDAAFVVATSDPAAVKQALRTWIEGQAGESEGIRRAPAWEDARTLKDGTAVSAFEVKEVVTGPGGDAMQRIVKQMFVGARGLHGFAKELPGALVVTYSQRADVLGRALKAASGAEGARTLGADATIKAMEPWLVPDPDVAVFLGVGELLGAAQQVAEMIPGADGAMLPAPAERMEPVGLAVRCKDATWEVAVVVPSGVLALGWDAAKAQLMPPPAPKAP